MIGNIRPAMDDAWRNDQHVSDLQLDFVCANRQAAAARTVRATIRVGRAVTATDNMAIDERRAAAGDDVIAFGLIVMRNGARNGVRRWSCHLLSTRDGLGRSLRIAPPGGRRGRRGSGGGAMNDAQLHAPAVADVDDPRILIS